jgi:hypothetical protein
MIDVPFAQAATMPPINWTKSTQRMLIGTKLPPTAIAVFSRASEKKHILSNLTRIMTILVKDAHPETAANLELRVTLMHAERVCQESLQNQLANISIRICFSCLMFILGVTCLGPVNLTTIWSTRAVPSCSETDLRLWTMMMAGWSHAPSHIS